MNEKMYKASDVIGILLEEITPAEFLKVAKRLSDIPSAVVRCKDCEHRKEKTCFHPCSGMWVGAELKDNDFCSYGERKEK